jgi:hypothetical protein
MAIENPVKESEKAADVLTDDQYQQVKDGKLAVTDLSKEQNNQLRTRLLDEREPEEKPPEEKPVEKPKEEKKPEEKPEEGKSEKDADKPKRRKPTNWRDELKQEADKANRIEQKIKSMKIRHEKAQKEFEELQKKEIEVKGEDDPYDEKNFKKFVKETKINVARLQEQNQFLLNQLAGRDQEDANEYMGRLEDSQTKKTFSAINDIQESLPDLKTKVDFKKLDREWLGFQDTVIRLSGVDADKLNLTEDEKNNPGVVQAKLRDEAMRRYDRDKMLRKEAEEYFPDSLKEEGEMEKYSLICEAVTRSRNPRIGGTVKGNLLEILDEEDLIGKSFEKRLKEEVVAGSKKTAAAIEKKSPDTLNPSDGPGTSPSGGEEMTRARAEGIIQKLEKKRKAGQRLTPEEGNLNRLARKFILEEEGNK